MTVRAGLVTDEREVITVTAASPSSGTGQPHEPPCQPDDQPQGPAGSAGPAPELLLPRLARLLMRRGYEVRGNRRNGTITVVQEVTAEDPTESKPGYEPQALTQTIQLVRRPASPDGTTPEAFVWRWVYHTRTFTDEVETDYEDIATSDEITVEELANKMGQVVRLLPEPAR